VHSADALLKSEDFGLATFWIDGQSYRVNELYGEDGIGGLWLGEDDDGKAVDRVFGKMGSNG
jgi:hypothetical protein